MGAATLYNLLATSAEKHPGRLACRFHREGSSYKQLHTNILTLAFFLHATLRPRPGENSVLFSEISAHHLVVNFAQQALALVENPRESNLEPAAASEFLRELDARLVFLQSPAILRNLFPDGLPPGTDAIILEPGADRGIYQEVPQPPEPGNWWQATTDRFTAAATSTMDEFLEKAGRRRGGHLWPLDEILRLWRPARKNHGPVGLLFGKDFQRLINERQAYIKRQPHHVTAARIRTSGTTGHPKFIPISHGNFLHQTRVIPPLVGIDQRDRFLNCLPPWHLYCRLIELIALASGSQVIYAEFSELARQLKESQPTIFPGFPEIWERIFHEVEATMENRGWPARVVFRLSLFIGRSYQYWHTIGQGAEIRLRPGKNPLRWPARLTTWFLRPFYGLFNRIVFHKIRASLGGRLRFAVVGDAPLPPYIDETLKATGLSLLEGYGSTEQCISAIRHPSSNTLGTVGRVLPEVSVLVTDPARREMARGEIGQVAVSGPNVYAGHNLEPARFFQRDGRLWYATGDMGRLDYNDNLIIVGREKNRFQLADGTWVYPELTENILRGSRYFERAVLLGEGRPWPVVLLLPDFPELIRYLARRHRRQKTPNRISLEGLFAPTPDMENRRRKLLPRLNRLPAVRNLYEREFDTMLRMADLPPAQIPRRMRVLDRFFRPGKEITFTLKTRREYFRREPYESITRELYEENL